MVINSDLHQDIKYPMRCCGCTNSPTASGFPVKKSTIPRSSPNDRTATSTHIYQANILCTLYKLLGQPSRTLSETMPSTTKGWATLCPTTNAGERNPSTTTGRISEFTTEFPSHGQSQQQQPVLLEFGQQVSPCCSHPATIRYTSPELGQSTHTNAVRII